MRQARSSATLLVLILLANAGAAQAPRPAVTGQGASAAITASDVFSRISFLASDELKGRDTPSPGLEAAARYIAAEFASFGLKPAGDSGTFIQRFPYQRQHLSSANVRTILTAGAWTRPLTYKQEFFVLQGQSDSVSGAVFYAGTASTQPSALPASARGKVLAFYIPGDSANSAWLEKVRATLTIAFAAAPQGILLLLDPTFGADQIDMIATNVSERLPVPLAGIRYDAVKEWFTRGNADFDAVRARNAADAATANTLTITMVTKPETQSSNPPNVIGVLTGSDPTLRGEYIVISAHMDHVGVGAPNAQGDSIFNGADDDASGTSAVLEVAQSLAALPESERPKRSVLFLAVSGEEKGLLGSQHFAAHPTVPIEKIVANINIDMIGRNNPDTVVAIGQDYTTLGATVQQVAKSHANLKLTVAPDLWPQEQLFFRSDHFSFAAKKVPAIFFTTGLHADYHQPSDEVETIDTDKVARIAQLIEKLTLTVANAPEPPRWTDQGTAAMRAITGNE